MVGASLRGAIISIAGVITAVNTMQSLRTFFRLTCNMSQVYKRMPQLVPEHKMV